MKRYLFIFALYCCIAYTSQASAWWWGQAAENQDSSLFHVGVNPENFEKINAMFFNRLDESIKNFFTKPENEGGVSAAQEFVASLESTGKGMLGELRSFMQSLAKTSIYLGVTGISGSCAVYSLYKTILEFILYKKSTTDTKKQKHIACLKYHAFITTCSAAIALVSGYKLVHAIESLTQTSLAPSVR